MDHNDAYSKKPMAIHDNHMYRKEKGGFTEHWKCKETYCNGRIHIRDGKVLKLAKSHCHPADRSDVLVHCAKMEIKRRAADTVETPRQITDTVLRNVPLEAGVLLPSYSALQRTIERTRKANSVPLARPTTLADIDTERYDTTSLRGERFLLMDTGKDDPQRILAFATEQNIRRLAECEVWLADGTFKVTPAPFTQVYTVHGDVDGAVIPLVYFLLPNKAAATYERAFECIDAKIKELPGGISRSSVGPKFMILDFEQAAMIAFKKIFKSAQIQGCTFHLGQSIYRKIQELGLATRYGDDLAFRTHCKMLPALAFVPVGDIEVAWQALLQMPGLTLDVDGELVGYFGKTYIGEMGRNGIRWRPLFSPSFWNCHVRLQEGVHRTNNKLEAWHLAFARTIGCHHPTIIQPGFLPWLLQRRLWGEGLVLHCL